MDKLKNTCRLCLSSLKGGRGLFVKANEKYLQQFVEMFGIKIEELPEWPKKACKSCIQALDNAHELKEKIFSTQEHLSQIATDVKVEMTPISELEATESPLQITQVETKSEIEILPEEMEDLQDPFAYSSDDSDVWKEEEEEMKAVNMDDAKKGKKTKKPPKKKYKTKDKDLLSEEEIERRRIRSERKKADMKEAKEKYDRDRVPIENLMRTMDLLKCHICRVEYPDFNSIKHHIQNDHNISVGYIFCCDRKFDRRSAFDHMRYHMNKEAFPCPICGKFWQSDKDRKVHMRNTHPTAEQKNVKCEICGKRFVRPSILRAHLKTHLPQTDRPFKCPDCPDKGFVCPATLNTHIRAVHEKVKDHFCEFCGKGFSTKTNLQAHRRAHGEMRTEECDICGKQVYNVKGHKKRLHLPTTEERVACEICGKEYVQARLLKAHMRHCHSGRTFSCDICDKVFTLEKSLRDHVQRHSGLKVDCYFCPAQATNSGNLVKHLNQVHPVKYAEYKRRRFSGQRVRTNLVEETMLQ